MVQTLQNRELPPDIGLVVLDECHTASYYSIFKRVMDHYSGGILALSPTFFIGLSATPWRTKKKEGYCQYFQAIAKAPSPDKLIEKGHLSPARCFGWNGLADFDQLESGSDGDFSQESMKALCDEGFNKKVIEKFIEFAPQRKAIAFCANCEQAEDLTKQFNECGVTAETVIGGTSEEDRELIYARFKSGQTQILSSVGVLCEGFDETSVDAVVLARPTKSIALLIQMSGRGLRLHPGKEDCYLLDFCEKFDRLGLPTKERDISLCPNTKKLDFEPTKTCPDCDAVVPIFAQVCPHCGHEFGEGQGEGEQLTLDLDKAMFGEILSEEEKKQCRYLRTQLRNAFRGGRDVGRVPALFFNKFNKIPPKHWFEDAIFRRGRHPHPDQRKADQYALIAQIRKTRVNANNGHLGEMLRNEFGKAFYSLDQIDWWNELGIEKTKDYQLVKEAYQKAIATADKGKAALLNLALEEARNVCSITTIQKAA